MKPLRRLATGLHHDNGDGDRYNRRWIEGGDPHSEKTDEFGFRPVAFGNSEGDGRGAAPSECFGTPDGDGEGDGNEATLFILACADLRDLRVRAINLNVRAVLP